MSATVLDLSNNAVNIKYSVNVDAKSDIEWQSDEHPTGWSYKADSPTYTTYHYAEPGPISISSIKFLNDGWTVNNEEMTFEEARSLIKIESLKTLLSPNIYLNVLEPLFDKEAENIKDSDSDDYFDDEDYYDNRY